MDFLAFLVQKLWQNKRKLMREIPGIYYSIFPGELGSFGHNLGTRNARKSIWGFAASYSSLEYNQYIPA